MSDQVLINGNAHSWASTKLKIANETTTGVTAIKYAEKRERAKGYGMNRGYRPRARTSGKYTVEPVTLTLYKATAQELRERLAAKSSDGNSYGNIEFTMVLQFIEPIGDKPITIEFEGCRWDGTNASAEENPDPTMDEVTFDCMGIKHNGKTLYDGGTT